MGDLQAFRMTRMREGECDEDHGVATGADEQGLTLGEAQCGKTAYVLDSAT